MGLGEAWQIFWVSLRLRGAPLAFAIFYYSFISCSLASGCVSVGLRQLFYQMSDVLNVFSAWARVCCPALHESVG